MSYPLDHLAHPRPVCGLIPLSARAPMPSLGSDHPYCFVAPLSVCLPRPFLPSFPGPLVIYCRRTTIELLLLVPGFGDISGPGGFGNSANGPPTCCQAVTPRREACGFMSPPPPPPPPPPPTPFWNLRAASLSPLISPLLFFCLVLSLFFLFDPFLLLAHSPDLLFPKPLLSER